MTLLIHLLMRLTTLFERGVIVEEVSENLVKRSKDLADNQSEME